MSKIRNPTNEMKYGYIVHIQGARVCGKHSEHLGRVWKHSSRSGEQPTQWSLLDGGGWWLADALLLTHVSIELPNTASYTHVGSSYISCI